MHALAQRVPGRLVGDQHREGEVPGPAQVEVGERDLDPVDRCEPLAILARDPAELGQ